MHRQLSSVRWFAGISVSATCRRIESAMLGVHGHGHGAPVEIRKTIPFDIPRDITALFDELQGNLYDKSSRRPDRDHADVVIPTTLYHRISRELASIEEEAVNELLAESRLTAADVLAVGVSDPGIRSVTADGLYYQGLCDASYLAEQTGLNVISDFPAQDIAAKGNGGPLYPMPVWIFLKSNERNRLLLDLGRTARLTFVPQAADTFAYQKIDYQDIVSCGALLDMLTWQLTGGRSAVDIGGRLAVQGQQIPDLLVQLREAVPPRNDWMPLGLLPDRYLQIAAAFTNKGHSQQDVLCTACFFIAETIAAALQRYDAEVFLTGSVRQHGLLMNLLSKHHRTLIPLAHINIPANTFDALCTAMLTLLTTEHIPGNLPQLTGSEGAKQLGRITPGSQANWFRFLQETAGVKPVMLPLKRAA